MSDNTNSTSGAQALQGWQCAQASPFPPAFLESLGRWAEHVVWTWLNAVGAPRLIVDLYNEGAVLVDYGHKAQACQFDAATVDDMLATVASAARALAAAGVAFSMPGCSMGDLDPQDLPGELRGAFVPLAPPRAQAGEFMALWELWAALPSEERRELARLASHGGMGHRGGWAEPATCGACGHEMARAGDDDDGAPRWACINPHCPRYNPL